MHYPDGAMLSLKRPPGQAGKTAAAAETQAKPVPAADPAAAARPSGWAAAAVRYAPVIAVAATMTVFGLWGLARHQAMSNDEVASRWAASLSLPQLAHLLRHVDAWHGLYYLLLHGWMAVGRTPTVLRLPSVIGMVIAAALMVIIVRRLTGSGWTGLFAGLIMAMTPDISTYAQTMRSYALVYACVLGQILALLSALQAEKSGAPRSRIIGRWVTYGGLVTLGAYLHEISLLVLAAYAVTVLLARYGRRAVWHWAVTSAISAALASPALVLGAMERGAADFLKPPGSQALMLLYREYFGSTAPAAALVTACAIVAVLPPGRWWRRMRGGAAAGTSAPPVSRWWRSGGISLPSVAVPLLLLPASLLIIESLVARPVYQDRYVLFGEAGAAMLAGYGAYRIGKLLAPVARQPSFIILPGIAVCTCVLLLQFQVQQHKRSPGSRGYDFGAPSFYVGQHADSGDGILYMSPFYRKAELGYPYEFRKITDFALAVPPVAAASYNGIDKPFPVIGRLMLSYRRIWVIGYQPSLLLRAGSMRQESLVLFHDFHRQLERRFQGMWLTLWVQR
jgi:mannosyltransferase